MDYEALQAENEALKVRILELENNYLKTINAHKEELIKLNKRHISELEQLRNALDQIEQLKRIIYGRKSERFVGVDNQLNLFSGQVENKEADSEVQHQQIPAHERKVKKSKHKGRTLLSQCGHLEVEEIILDAPDCPDGIKIGEVITEKIAIRKEKLYVKRIIRYKKKDPETEKISIAPLPPEPIEKCEADVSLLAHVPVAKFVDHNPEYRIQQQFKRQGVVIPPSTMNNWTHKIAELLNPLCTYIKKEILQSAYVQMDESTIRVMDGKKQRTHLGYMWVMNSPEKNQVYFEYHSGRGRAGPEEMLKDYQGALQTDGYEVYESLDKQYAAIDLYACWAHARRYFEKALANDRDRAQKVMTDIQALYRIERDCREQKKDTQQRQQIRQQEAMPILEAFKAYLDDQALVVTPSSLIGKAIAYTLKRWKKLTAYVDDGRIEIDNNLIENAIRPLALGRKNYLFTGNHDAAANIANYYTIFGTCKKQNVNPYDYLVWYLQRVSETSIQNIASLSPAEYKKQSEK
jgi:transposase